MSAQVDADARVTVWEFEEREDFDAQWCTLVRHLEETQSDLLVLPEFPFCRWELGEVHSDPRRYTERWSAMVAAHEHAQRRYFAQLPAGVSVLATRPVFDTGAHDSVASVASAAVALSSDERHFEKLVEQASMRPSVAAQHRNEAFVWTRTAGYRRCRHKYYLPDQEGNREALWCRPAVRPDFVAAEVSIERTGRTLLVGFLICTELWFFERAREYFAQRTDLLVVPRCTGVESVPRWRAAGLCAAAVCGAYLASANRRSAEFGGVSFVLDPDGALLGDTDQSTPFCTVELSRAKVRAARLSYPRYIYASVYHARLFECTPLLSESKSTTASGEDVQSAPNKLGRLFVSSMPTSKQFDSEAALLAEYERLHADSGPQGLFVACALPDDEAARLSSSATTTLMASYAARHFEVHQTVVDGFDEEAEVRALRLAAAAAEALRSGRHVVAHCHSGMGRGAVLALLTAAAVSGERDASRLRSRGQSEVTAELLEKAPAAEFVARVIPQL